MAKVPLSLIREFYEAEFAKPGFENWTRREMVKRAYAKAHLEVLEGERAKAELAEGLYDLASERDGSPEDDCEGELPW